MASNSSANELRQHAEIFRRWAEETDSPDMREAFLSLAAGLADRLAYSGPGAIQSATSLSPRNVLMMRGRLNLRRLESRSLTSEDHNFPTPRLRREGGLDRKEKQGRFAEQN